MSRNGRLVVSGVNSENIGKYKCVASNVKGKVERIFVIKVCNRFLLMVIYLVYLIFKTVFKHNIL